MPDFVAAVLYRGTLPNNSSSSPYAQRQRIISFQDGYRWRTFGRESCIFHVSILTLKHFGSFGVYLNAESPGRVFVDEGLADLGAGGISCVRIDAEWG